MLHPKTLDLTIPFIEEFEGVELKAYLCPAGVPTICAGLTRYPNGTPVMMGDVCTKTACDGYLLEQLAKEFVPCLEAIPGFSEFGPHRQAALLSFAWNMGARFYGADNFETISRVLRTKAYEEMRSALMLYCKAGGQVLEGLQRRRTAEADMWDKETGGVMTVTTIHDTYFKKAPIDSQYLSSGEGKLFVKAGNSMEITQIEEANGNHAEITIEGSGEKWFIYQPHWEVTVEPSH